MMQREISFHVGKERRKKKKKSDLRLLFLEALKMIEELFEIKITFIHAYRIMYSKNSSANKATLRKERRIEILYSFVVLKKRSRYKKLPFPKYLVRHQIKW